eukprot:1518341-Prymnesium_polylepis.1
MAASTVASEYAAAASVCSGGNVRVQWLRMAEATRRHSIVCSWVTFCTSSVSYIAVTRASGCKRAVIRARRASEHAVGSPTK